MSAAVGSGGRALVRGPGACENRLLTAMVEWVMDGSAARNARAPLAGKTVLLWDHDGVLVETEPVFFAACERALAELGVACSAADYHARMINGGSLMELALQAGVAEATIRQKWLERDRYYLDALAQRAPENLVIPGVEALLARLAKRLRMAIVTSSKRVAFDLIHRHTQVVEPMELVLTYEDYSEVKPSPVPYLTALQRMAVPSASALVIEDTERGLRSALAAGLDCVVVASDFVQGQDFSGAIAHINSLQELPALLGFPPIHPEEALGSE